MTNDLTLIERIEPAIVRLTLNRPEKRNALSIALIESLTQSIAANADARVLILKANGPAFCAGLDLTEAEDPNLADRSARSLAVLYEALATSPAVTIAAAQGAAMGGGAGLLAACDLVVAADDLRLGFPEVHRGLVAALITCLLHRQLPDRQLRELILLGQTIDAGRALALGLVNAVASRADDAALELGHQALRGAPGAISRSKRLLAELSARSLRDEIAIALRYHLEARQSAESVEGIAAFREKREPRWETPDR